MSFSAKVSLVTFLSSVLSVCLSSAAVDRVKVKPTEDVTLECQDPRQAAIKVLEWSRLDLDSDSYVFFYRNNHSYENYQLPLYQGRVKLRDESSIKDGDGSVVLKNVSTNDTGPYECRIIIGTTRDRGRSSMEFMHFVNVSVSEGHTDEDPENRRNERGRSGLEATVILVAVVVVLFLLVEFKHSFKLDKSVPSLWLRSTRAATIP